MYNQVYIAECVLAVFCGLEPQSSPLKGDALTRGDW